MKRFTLSRRTVLRGVAGGALAQLALPTLDAMLDGNGTAFAQDNAPLPKRFVSIRNIRLRLLPRSICRSTKSGVMPFSEIWRVQASLVDLPRKLSSTGF